MNPAQIAEHYWKVVEDLERQRAVIDSAIFVCTENARSFSEQAIREKPPEQPEPQEAPHEKP